MRNVIIKINIQGTCQLISTTSDQAQPTSKVGDECGKN